MFAKANDASTSKTQCEAPIPFPSFSPRNAKFKTISRSHYLQSERAKENTTLTHPIESFSVSLFAEKTLRSAASMNHSRKIVNIFSDTAQISDFTSPRKPPRKKTQFHVARIFTVNDQIAATALGDRFRVCCHSVGGENLLR